MSSDRKEQSKVDVSSFGINGADGENRTPMSDKARWNLNPSEGLNRGRQDTVSGDNPHDSNSIESTVSTVNSYNPGDSRDSSVTWTGDAFVCASGGLHGRIYKRGRVWCIYYNSDTGGRHRATLRTRDRAVAVRMADASFYALDRGQALDHVGVTTHRLNPGSIATKGAIAEYAVMADLMSQGFEVYRAASPNSSCDLVVLTASRAVRVEVKCGQWDVLNGPVQLPAISNAERFDVLAVYSRHRRAVQYRPSIDAFVAMTPACFKEMESTGKVPKLRGESKATKQRREQRRSHMNQIARGPSKYFPEFNVPSATSETAGSSGGAR